MGLENGPLRHTATLQIKIYCKLALYTPNRLIIIIIIIIIIITLMVVSRAVVSF